MIQHELVIINGPETGRRFELKKDSKLVIGRGQASDTKINDPRMSRVHCEVEVLDDTVVLRDGGSSSGTLMDGQQVSETKLRSGSIFSAGDSQFRYQLAGDNEQETLGGLKPKVASPTTPLADLVGTTLSRFRLDKIVAKGNSGMVFAAFDTEKDIKVAVKVLAADFAETEEQKQRFVRAMKTMMPIRHENIVQLYAAGKNGPHCWAAMEFVEGESLAQLIQRIGTAGMLDWKEVLRVAVHVTRALEAAFDNDIIHRNLTPQNLLRRESDKVTKVGDLMLAKALSGSLAKQVTAAGQLVGDVPFMSPERTQSDVEVDGRSDIYELGATLYALLTGRAPFEDNSLPMLIKKVREDEPVEPKKYHLSIPDQFQGVVLKMLSKRPDDRFANPTQLLENLKRVASFQGLNCDNM